MNTVLIIYLIGCLIVAIFILISIKKQPERIENFINNDNFFTREFVSILFYLICFFMIAFSWMTIILSLFKIIIKTMEENENR